MFALSWEAGVLPELQLSLSGVIVASGEERGRHSHVSGKAQGGPWVKIDKRGRGRRRVMYRETHNKNDIYAYKDTVSSTSRGLSVLLPIPSPSP